MEMEIEIGILFSTAIALIGVYATYHKISNDNRKEHKEREKEIRLDQEKQTERHIELKKSMEFLSTAVTQALTDIRVVDGKYDALDRRVTVTEESSKSAHRRIDGIENKCELRHKGGGV